MTPDPSPASLADAAYTAAVQAAVGGYGTWEAVQQAGIVAKCARRDQNNKTGVQ